MNPHDPFTGFPHILETQQFPVEFLIRLFTLADAIRSRPEAHRGRLANRIVFIAFNQESTRTFFSFQLAATLLDAIVIANQQMGKTSSVAKGESFRGTIKTLREYNPHYLVVRWDTEESVAQAAEILGPGCPVINGGNGPGQHPTQAMLDLYTLWRRYKDDLNRELTVAIVGDLERGRTTHSLAYLIGKLFPNVRLIFISPKSAQMKPEVLEYLKRHEHPFTICTDSYLGEVTPTCDVVYMTRPQLNLEDDEEKQRLLIEEYRPLILTPDVVQTMKPDAMILHPLPQSFELPEEIDDDPRAWYYQQAGNGLPLRMSIFEILEGMRPGIMAALHTT